MNCHSGEICSGLGGDQNVIGRNFGKAGTTWFFFQMDMEMILYQDPTRGGTPLNSSCVIGTVLFSELRVTVSL